MPLLSSHRYAADCVCPSCAGYRVDRKQAVINDFIHWANAPLRAGMMRFVDSRPKVEGVDLPLKVARAAGLALRHLTVKSVRLIGHARA
jgi:hypothetical protein